eukprot:CAMPEP_0117547278 /NCGR_PEP_ID=MMETSP0784-20121206/47043_1 /TAXON_ID=39447 /ORGANISM="" /LENGTH=100 /DNA_ID=CAMNT_0005344181 /DNA_START=563 /DNA_END=865 /DNA_ORIENTATION=+
MPANVASTSSATSTPVETNASWSANRAFLHETDMPLVQSLAIWSHWASSGKASNGLSCMISSPGLILRVATTPSPFPKTGRTTQQSCGATPVAAKAIVRF